MTILGKSAYGWEPMKKEHRKKAHRVYVEGMGIVKGGRRGELLQCVKINLDPNNAT